MKRFIVWSMTIAMLLGALPGYAVEAALEEPVLIGILQSDANWEAKQDACRGLRRVGTEQAIPALAALLNDKELSHMARYALEPMPYPAVDAALRDALLTTTGTSKVGVVITLGMRRDKKAVSMLAPMMKADDAALSHAATGALGRIASPKAVKALRKETAGDLDQTVLAEALLTAGNRLLADGESRLARSIFEDLLTTTWPAHIRMGAFHGMAYAHPRKAPEQLIAALEGDNEAFRGMAAQIVAETQGAKETQRYAKALKHLPPEGQVALLWGLADRADTRARAAVAAEIGNDSKAVQLAALKTLCILGSAAEVDALAALLLSEDSAIVDGATETLTKMKDRDVDATITETIPGVAAPIQAQLLAVLNNRDADQAVPMALTGLDSPDAVVRIAALEVLGDLGTDTELPAILDFIKAASAEDEADAAEESLGALASRQGEGVVPAIVAAMQGAPEAAQLSMLRTMGRIGGEQGLQTVLGHLDDSNSALQEEALDLLSNWRSMDAAPHLLTLAQSGDANRKVLGMRGYVRLARGESDAGTKAEMLTTAMGLAQAQDDKWLVISAWGTLHTQASLKFLTPYLDDASVKNETAMAMINAAKALGKSNESNKAAAKAALETIQTKCADNAAILETAKRALAEIK